MKKMLYTLKEVDKILGFTEQDLIEIEQDAKKIIQRMELRAIRKKKGFTQADLAKKAGIPRPTISRIENGERNVTMRKLKRIANALDMDLEIRFVEKAKS